MADTVKPVALNQKEKQIYLLFVLAYGIDSFINYTVLEGIQETEKEQYLLPQTVVHESYFYIMLLDLLKIYVPWSEDKLDLLKEIQKLKKLEGKLNIDELIKSVEELNNWLEEKQGIPLWLPYQSKNHCLDIKRIKSVQIYANLKKHNFTNLSRVQNEILYGLRQKGLTRTDILKDLPAIEERLQYNEMHSWMSIIVSSLIEIRKELHKYLLPLAESQHKLIDDPRYEWEMPSWIEEDSSEFFFWDLMNIVRSGPIFKFRLTPLILKDRSCKDDVDEH